MKEEKPLIDNDLENDFDLMIIWMIIMKYLMMMKINFSYFKINFIKFNN